MIQGEIWYWRNKAEDLEIEVLELTRQLQAQTDTCAVVLKDNRELRKRLRQIEEEKVRAMSYDD